MTNDDSDAVIIMPIVGLVVGFIIGTVLSAGLIGNPYGLIIVCICGLASAFNGWFISAIYQRFRVPFLLLDDRYNKNFISRIALTVNNVLVELERVKSKSLRKDFKSEEKACGLISMIAMGLYTGPVIGSTIILIGILSTNEIRSNLCGAGFIILFMGVLGGGLVGVLIGGVLGASIYRLSNFIVRFQRK
jgi:hypothetical protein